MSDPANDRLLGELIGEMRGMRVGFQHLSDSLEASIQSTHQRFEAVEKEVREVRSEKRLAIAHIKGGAFTATIIILVFVKGVFSTVTMVLGAISGIKL